MGLRRLCVVVPLSLSLTGCGIAAQSIYGWSETGSAQRTKTQAIGVDADRKDVTVQLDGTDVGTTPLEVPVKYRQTEVTRGPTSVFPLLLGLGLDVGAMAAASSKDQDVVLGLTVLAVAIDGIALLVQGGRKKEVVRRKNLPVQVKFVGRAANGESRDEQVVVPTSTPTVFFRFDRVKKKVEPEPKAEPARPAAPAFAPSDVQVIAVPGTSIWLDDQPYSLDALGGAFIEGVKPGYHVLRASTPFHLERKVSFRVGSNETVVIRVSPVDEDLKAIERKLTLDIPRKTGVVVLRSATAYPPVQYQIVHQTGFVAADSRAYFTGEAPRILNEFPSGRFTVRFVQGKKELKGEYVVGPKETINLRADFRSNKIDVVPKE